METKDLIRAVLPSVIASIATLIITKIIERFSTYTIEPIHIFLLILLFFNIGIVLFFFKHFNFSAYRVKVIKDKHLRSIPKIGRIYNSIKNKRSINTLNNKSIIFARISATDYSATSLRLRNNIARISDNADSVNIAGIYGQDDFNIEIISNTENKDGLIEDLNNIININGEEVTTTIKVLNVNSILKLHNSEIHKISNNERGVSLENNNFENDVKEIIYCTDNVHYRSGEFRNVKNTRIIIGYLWLELCEKDNNADQDILRGLYKSFADNNVFKNINSLYCIEDSILIKFIIPKENYYFLTQLTKGVDELVRLQGYNNLIRIRTDLAAEIIEWK